MIAKNADHAKRLEELGDDVGNLPRLEARSRRDSRGCVRLTFELFVSLSLQLFLPQPAMSHAKSADPWQSDANAGLMAAAAFTPPAKTRVAPALANRG
jgi:hypothetical protein